MGGAEKNWGAFFAIYHKNSEEDTVQENIPVPCTGSEYLVMLNPMPPREPNKYGFGT